MAAAAPALADSFETCNNWQRKYYQLSDVLITSLVGLTTTDTLNVLVQARKENLWLKNITKLEIS